MKEQKTASTVRLKRQRSMVPSLTGRWFWVMFSGVGNCGKHHLMFSLTNCKVAWNASSSYFWTTPNLGEWWIRWRAGLLLTGITACQKQTDKNLLNFNKDKRKVLHKGQRNSMQNISYIWTAPGTMRCVLHVKTRLCPKIQKKVQYELPCFVADCRYQKTL